MVTAENFSMAARQEKENNKSMKFQSLKNANFEALKKTSLAQITGGYMENGTEDTGKTTGTNRYDDGEAEHGKATSDCIVWRDGYHVRQEFWHADGYHCVWVQ